MTLAGALRASAMLPLDAQDGDGPRGHRPHPRVVVSAAAGSCVTWLVSFSGDEVTLGPVSRTG